jgi:uncharacterized protein YlxW (UPF0749 family)
MHIGTAIFVVAIIGFMIFSPGFRVMLAWLAAAVVGIFILFYAANTFSEYQAKERARIEAEKVEQQRRQQEQQRQQQLDAERREIEVIAPQVCSNLNARTECMEQTENACHAYSNLSERKSCMAIAASWCPDQSTRKQCIADTLRAQQAKKEEQARQAQRQAQQAQHDASCASIEREIPEAMERWRIRGGLYWEWLPQEYWYRRDCPSVEKAIDRALADTQRKF